MLLFWSGESRLTFALDCLHHGEPEVHDNTLKKMDGWKYDDVGKCIYCGSTEDLRDEHIVPFGLNGTAVLPKASCKDCEKTTSLFERRVLRGPMWAARVLRQLKSRRPQDAPKTEYLYIIKNGVEKRIELPIDKFPVLLHFPIYPPPAYLSPENYVDGILVSGMVTINYGISPENALAQHIPCDIKYRAHQYFWFEYAKMVAKIAYAMAVAEGAIRLLKGECLVLPSIVGKKNDIWRWVGTITKPLESHKGLLHKILLHQDPERKLLIGEVKLFADSQTPSYGVILGILK